MDEYLLDQLHACETLLGLQTDAQYWFGDFAKIVPKETNHELARIDAELAVVCGTFATPEDYLVAKYNAKAGETLTGDALSQLIDEILFCNIYDGGSDDIVGRLIAGLDAPLSNPGTCAKLLTKKSFLKTSLPVVESDAAELLAELRGMGWLDDDNRNVPVEYRHLIDRFVSRAVGDWESWLVECQVKAFDLLVNRSKIETRHPLYATDYALFIPPSHRRLILDPIQELIRQSADNPKLLRRISPRDFEKMLAEIFTGFGFDVELTLQTRDGGADLICMSHTGPIPFKVAVEAKRYAESNAITVDMVRSFVGANMKIRANKLVYVTTSRFTRDARVYASEPGVTELLELKAFSDIAQWAKDYSTNIISSFTKKL
ncbi:MAG: restriction endonuclease [Pirellulaceae bacterium]|nr:restriction endonuclease [Pirellulaceae bacterium]